MNRTQLVQRATWAFGPEKIEIDDHTIPEQRRTMGGMGGLQFWQIGPYRVLVDEYTDQDRADALATLGIDEPETPEEWAFALALAFQRKSINGHAVEPGVIVNYHNVTNDFRAWMNWRGSAESRGPKPDKWEIVPAMKVEVEAMHLTPGRRHHPQKSGKTLVWIRAEYQEAIEMARTLYERAKVLTSARAMYDAGDRHSAVQAGAGALNKRMQGTPLPRDNRVLRAVICACMRGVVGDSAPRHKATYAKHISQYVEIMAEALTIPHG